MSSSTSTSLWLLLLLLLIQYMESQRSTGKCSSYPPLCCSGLNSSCNRQNCFCDAFCVVNKDCCLDYNSTCLGDLGTISTSTTAEPPATNSTPNTSPVHTEALNSSTLALLTGRTTSGSTNGVLFDSAKTATSEANKFTVSNRKESVETSSSASTGSMSSTNNSVTHSVSNSTLSLTLTTTENITLSESTVSAFTGLPGVTDMSINRSLPNVSILAETIDVTTVQMPQNGTHLANSTTPNPSQTAMFSTENSKLLHNNLTTENMIFTDTTTTVAELQTTSAEFDHTFTNRNETEDSGLSESATPALSSLPGTTIMTINPSLPTATTPAQNSPVTTASENYISSSRTTIVDPASDTTGGTSTSNPVDSERTASTVTVLTKTNGPQISTVLTEDASTYNIKNDITSATSMSPMPNTSPFNLDLTNQTTTPHSSSFQMDLSPLPTVSETGSTFAPETSHISSTTLHQLSTNIPSSTLMNITESVTPAPVKPLTSGSTNVNTTTSGQNMATSTVPTTAEDTTNIFGTAPFPNVVSSGSLMTSVTDTTQGPNTSVNLFQNITDTLEYITSVESTESTEFSTSRDVYSSESTESSTSQDVYLNMSSRSISSSVADETSLALNYSSTPVNPLHMFNETALPQDDSASQNDYTMTTPTPVISKSNAFTNVSPELLTVANMTVASTPSTPQADTAKPFTPGTPLSERSSSDPVLERFTGITIGQLSRNFSNSSLSFTQPTTMTDSVTLMLSENITSHTELPASPTTSSARIETGSSSSTTETLFSGSMRILLNASSTATATPLNPIATNVREVYTDKGTLLPNNTSINPEEGTSGADSSFTSTSSVNPTDAPVLIPTLPVSQASTLENKILASSGRSVTNSGALHNLLPTINSPVSAPLEPQTNTITGGIDSNRRKTTSSISYPTTTLTSTAVSDTTNDVIEMLKTTIKISVSHPQVLTSSSVNMSPSSAFSAAPTVLASTSGQDSAIAVSSSEDIHITSNEPLANTKTATEPLMNSNSNFEASSVRATENSSLTSIPELTTVFSTNKETATGGSDMKTSTHNVHLHITTVETLSADAMTINTDTVPTFANKLSASSDQNYVEPTDYTQTTETSHLTPKIKVITASSSDTSDSPHSLVTENAVSLTAIAHTASDVPTDLPFVERNRIQTVSPASITGNGTFYVNMTDVTVGSNTDVHMTEPSKFSSAVPHTLNDKSMDGATHSTTDKSTHFEVADTTNVTELAITHTTLNITNTINEKTLTHITTSANGVTLESAATTATSTVMGVNNTTVTSTMIPDIIHTPPTNLVNSPTLSGSSLPSATRPHTKQNSTFLTNYSTVIPFSSTKSLSAGDTTVTHTTSGTTSLKIADLTTTLPQYNSTQPVKVKQTSLAMTILFPNRTSSSERTKPAVSSIISNVTETKMALDMKNTAQQIKATVLSDAETLTTKIPVSVLKPHTSIPNGTTFHSHGTTAHKPLHSTLVPVNVLPSVPAKPQPIRPGTTAPPASRTEKSTLAMTSRDEQTPRTDPKGKQTLILRMNVSLLTPVSMENKTITEALQNLISVMQNHLKDEECSFKIVKVIKK
uniref:Serine-rich adhesin for platelets-like n=1 Tax=Lepisosteus oculatus TaxID=7918 RepID=W5MEZ8_LEPOC|nr:PREDICTED: serine-rich adhesin for platelets-like isoform X1 [Lepisosteus oculatus]